MSKIEIEKTIFALLATRRPGASVCPSDVARSLAPGDEAAWRALMEDVRRVAQALAAEGRLRVTRGSETVDALSRGGPIRLRLTQAGAPGGASGGGPPAP